MFAAAILILVVSQLVLWAYPFMSFYGENDQEMTAKIYIRGEIRTFKVLRYVSSSTRSIFKVAMFVTHNSLPAYWLELAWKVLAAPIDLAHGYRKLAHDEVQLKQIAREQRIERILEEEGRRLELEFENLVNVEAESVHYQ